MVRLWQCMMFRTMFADYQQQLHSGETSSDSESCPEDGELSDPGSASEDEVMPTLQPLDEDDPEDDFSMFDCFEISQSLSDSLLKDMDDGVCAAVYRARHVPDPILMACVLVCLFACTLSDALDRTRALEGNHGTASLLLQLLEKHGCPRACRADLLNFLHLPGLDLASLPSTPHALEAFAESVIPRSVSPGECFPLMFCYCSCSSVCCYTFFCPSILFGGPSANLPSHFPFLSLQTEHVIELDGVKVYFFDLLEVVAEAIAAEPGVVLQSERC